MVSDHDYNGDDESSIRRGRCALLALGAAFVWPPVWWHAMAAAWPAATQGWGAVALFASVAVQALGLAGTAYWLTRRRGMGYYRDPTLAGLAAIVLALFLWGNALLVQLALPGV